MYKPRHHCPRSNTSRRATAHYGFTLVEVSIVLTVVGLLVGGILKGQEFVTHSRVTATIAQVKAIEAAVTTFKDTYNELPGDLSDGSARIPNCPNCNACSGLHVPGGCGWDNVAWNVGDADDGIVGRKHWDLQRSMARGSNFTVDSPSIRSSNETLFFWAELAQAQLLGGVSYNGSPLPIDAAAFDYTHPSARTGGGFLVGYADGSTDQPLSTAPSHPFLKGNVLVLAPSPLVDLSTTAGRNLFTPHQADQIDRKVDDGQPLTGVVQAYGHTANVSTQGCLDASAAPYHYNGAVSSKDCGLFFELP